LSDIVRPNRRTVIALTGGLLARCALTTKLFSEDDGSSSPDTAIASARGVLGRLLGSRSDEIALAWAPPQQRNEGYVISASRGRVHIKGSSGVALCRGAYAYLREACNAMVTWSGQHLALPAVFPDYRERRVVCPYEFVQYYNPVSFGYSTPFWNWTRWERELDWMALHGITMALAMEGQEAIWQRIWLKIGITHEELGRYFTGPGYLPWHRLGNLDNFDGPLPQGWIEQKRVLQKRILGRMRELGISPIVPGFSGFVPTEGFKRVAPQAKTHRELWGPGAPEAKTSILDPSELDLYKRIGGNFIREYKREFGPTHYYLVDTFNEIDVPVRTGSRYANLAQFAQTAYSGITAGDPTGVWVMQGWLFGYKPKFWDNLSIKAFLESVPNDRMMIIDYSSDSHAENRHAADDPTAHNIWKEHNAFFGKPWINGMAHTFGGNNNVKGNLALIAAQPAAVSASPAKGNLVGWSINPEGIETNEVVYELMTDIGWSETRIHPEVWIAGYCRARYGDYPAAMEKAWSLLMQSAYSWHSWHSRHGWQSRPTLEPVAINVDCSPIFAQAVEHFFSCADKLGTSDLYRNDLIELVAQVAGGSVDKHLLEACDAHRSGRPEVRDQKAKESLAMLLRIDSLMNVRTDRRLGTWIGAARSWGTTPNEKAYYDADSRRLITFWGWADLNDYASRLWSGLIRDYYVGRWRSFFTSLQENRAPAIDVWETNWLATLYVPSAPERIEDVVTEAGLMLVKCKDWL
jgi:alpha-N-acetylglucosaminidase